jgi:hypothetical protein
MAEIRLPNQRTLTESERQAYYRLGLTPGHVAALVAAPFFTRYSPHRPNVLHPADLRWLEHLRKQLKNADGYGEEARRFWRRLSTDRALVTLGVRLLAWHLANDLTLDQRAAFLDTFNKVAQQYLLPFVNPERIPTVVRAVRQLIEEYLYGPVFAVPSDPGDDPEPAPRAEGNARTWTPSSTSEPVARPDPVAPEPAPRVLLPEFVQQSVPLPEVAPAVPREPAPAPEIGPPLAPVRAPIPEPSPAPATRPGPERVRVTTAEPFSTVTLESALARARATTVTDVCAWVDAGPRLLFDDCRDESPRAVAVVKANEAVPPVLWVVGDVHADVLALANILAHAQARAGEPPHFLLLGDFVDRGIHDHETLLLLFGVMMAHPERVCVVPGNHDIDLQFDEKTGRFRVTIEPAEYCEALNAALGSDAAEDRERVELARAFVRFCAGRPKAVFLPDGTLFAHGGFPHTDVQKDIATLADLCRPRCVDDFLWARIAESARVKRPNRGSRGHEFGWDTLVQFARIATERLGIPVKRLVRGHDHVPDRWQEYPDYADNGVPVLTLNAMGRTLDGDPARRDGRKHPFPVVARCVPDHLPEVVLLPLDPAEVDRAFRTPARDPVGEAPEGQSRPASTEPAERSDVGLSTEGGP